jgi:hypothetical protein
MSTNYKERILNAPELADAESEIWEMLHEATSARDQGLDDALSFAIITDMILTYWQRQAKERN